MIKKNYHPFFPAVWLVFLLCLFFAASIAAADEKKAATVVALRGKIQAIDKSSNVRSLAVKSTIYEGDTIKTSQRGRIQILFTDNTIYSLGRNSEIKITEYLWKPKAETGSLKTEVKEGVFRVMGGAITKTSPDNFITETPAATIGIRGSMYAGTVSESSLSVVFNGGKGIVISNEFGAVDISRPGHGTHVQLNKKPAPPVKFSEQEVAELNLQLAPEGKDETDQPQESPPPSSEDSQSSEDTSSDEDAPPPPPVDETAADIDASGVETPPSNEFSPVIDTSDPEEIPTDPTASSTYPVNGLTTYKGMITGSSVIASSGLTESVNDTSWAEINWHNGRIIGRVPGLGSLPPIFFMGDVLGDTISNITLLGSDNGLSDPTTGEIIALKGSGSGSLTGSGKDYYNITLSGNGYEIRPAGQTLFDTWTVTDSAVRGPIDPEDINAPTGSSTFKGFVTGVSEDMNNIDINRRLFISHDFGDFALSVDKDQGTVTGFLTAADASSPTSFLNGITIGGGTSNSAYVLNDNLAALLTCPGGNCVQSSFSTGPLKSYGNFLISTIPQDPNNDVGDYATWGYWEIAYTDPTTGGQYHTHVPGSRWVAGEPTPVTDVNALSSAGLFGNYSGIALASKVDTTVLPGNHQVTDLQGTFAIDVDFANITAKSAVKGTINLPGEPTFLVNSGAAGNASASGFTNGSISGAVKSDFNGAFYGPEAKSIGGNYFADFGAGVSYIGIYVGNR